MSDLATPRPWKQSGRYITGTDARETIVFEVCGAIENPSVQADVDLTLASVNGHGPTLQAIRAEIEGEIALRHAAKLWRNLAENDLVAGLGYALAIIDRHMKETGGE